jgi:type I protein arginine methyltransferase
MLTRRISVGSSGQSHVEARVRQPIADAADPEFWPSVGEFPIYDSFLYHVMTSDSVRCARYVEAIHRSVRGRVVVDIGTGQDANWAIESARAGAAKVYAMEEIPAAARKASARIAKLGLRDKIEIVEGNSSAVDLPERADVCVSQVIGMIGSSEGACAVLRDAKARLVKPDGLMIPGRCVTRIAAASLPDRLHGTPEFGAIAVEYVERLFEHAGRPFDFRLCVRNVDREALLSDACVFEDLDFTKDVAAEWETRVAMTIVKEGRLDGLLLWIELWIGDEHPITSLDQQTTWLPVFLPAFYPGVPVRPGDTLEASCRVSLSADGVHPDYSVTGTLRSRTGAPRFTIAAPYLGQPFRASPLFAALFPY